MRRNTGEGGAPPPAAAAPGLPRSGSSGLSSLSPDEAIHLLQSQVRGDGTWVLGFNPLVASMAA
jgi:hypothetical protein